MWRAGERERERAGGEVPSVWDTGTGRGGPCRSRQPPPPPSGCGSDTGRWCRCRLSPPATHLEHRRVRTVISLKLRNPLVVPGLTARLFSSYPWRGSPARRCRRPTLCPGSRSGSSAVCTLLRCPLVGPQLTGYHAAAVLELGLTFRYVYIYIYLYIIFFFFTYSTGFHSRLSWTWCVSLLWTSPSGWWSWSGPSWDTQEQPVVTSSPPTISQLMGLDPKVGHGAVLIGSQLQEQFPYDFEFFFILFWKGILKYNGKIQQYSIYKRLISWTRRGQLWPEGHTWPITAF